MTLLTVLFVLCGVALVGFLMWLFNRHVMLAAPYKAIINLIVLVVTIVVLLHVFGVWHALSKIKL
jgi:asparagine N-glycosylation enzyme membrane subunit Stt3